jgi:hypothetical protein
MPRYEIWYTDDAGNHLELLNTTQGFDYTLVDGDVGWINVPMPYDNGRIYNNPQVDNRIHIYRAPDGASLQLVAIGFIRRWGNSMEASGLATTRLSGGDPNELIKRRIVAYFDRTNYSIKDGPADDVMKAYARENLGSLATEAGRDMSALGVSVQGDLSAGPDIEIAAAFENLLAVFQQIQQTTRGGGAEVFWRMRAATPDTFIFETRTGQPGNDRSFDGNNPLYFGSQFGNITNATMETLRDSEINFVYAGGEGEGVLQNVQSASDATAVAASRWNRREGYVAASQANTVAKVQDAAAAEVIAKRAQLRFTADLIPTPLTPLGGNGWWLGDKITISHLGQQITAIIRMIRVSVSGGGLETASARVEGIL